MDYVPVNYNLVSKVEWAHTHPEKAESMVQHSRSVINQHVRAYDKQCYTYRLMLEYQDLFET